MNKVRKMLTASGGPLQLTPKELKYLEWSKMTPELKREYRNNRINAELQRGPNIKHFWEAFQTYIGNRDPENPHLNTGIVNAPGRATPQLILLSAKLMETINNYWKNLGKLKVRLSGGRATSGILTKPGTASTTFNGLNINYITSPKGGNVTHKFYTDLGSEYILTKDGFARRIKSPHNNTLGQNSGPTEWNAANSDAGLHNWNEGTTIFTEGEDGKLFNAAFYKLSDFGFKPGTYGLARKGEKARIMLIDPKTKLWRAAMLSDVYPTTVKLGLQADRVMETNYSDVPKLGWHILEKANGGWHPGSPVAFIEGLKQGGKMNILEFLKNGNKIRKAQWGADLVDTRSDTTNEGYNPNPIPLGAGNGPAGLSPLVLLEGLNNFLSPKINNPYLITGVAPNPSKVNMSLYKNAKAILKKDLYDEGFVNFVDRLARGKITPRFITKNNKVSPANYNYVDLRSETISKGPIKGNDITFNLVKLPLEGLRIVKPTPFTLKNYVLNPAERAAAEDFMKETGIKVSTKLPTGRPSGDYMYPKDILQKYGLGPKKPSIKTAKPKTAKNTSTEVYHDKREYSKAQRTKDKNARAMEYEKATMVNSGQSRMKNLQVLLVRDNMSKYPKFELKNLEKLKLKLFRRGLSEKAVEKELIPFYRGLAEKYGFFKQGGGIHIKPENRGKFTSYCGGKVTSECIARGKRSSSPTIRKRATFADNARHFKHLLGGNIIFPNDSNPNAFGGVFANILLGKQRDYELLLYKKKLKEQQTLVDLQLEQLKSDVVSNILGTAINYGLNYLSKYENNKK